MPRKLKVRLVDEEDPEGSVERVSDHLQKREACRKAREAGQRKRMLIADTPEAVSWLGGFFYALVAQALLADPANFGEDGMPTEDAMQQAAETMVDAAANALMEFPELGAGDIFHRVRLEAFANDWGLPNL